MTYSADDGYGLCVIGRTWGHHGGILKIAGRRTHFYMTKQEVALATAETVHKWFNTKHSVDTDELEILTSVKVGMTPTPGDKSQATVEFDLTRMDFMHDDCVILFMPQGVEVHIPIRIFRHAVIWHYLRRDPRLPLLGSPLQQKKFELAWRSMLKDLRERSPARKRA